MIIPKFKENQKHKILRNVRDLDLNAVNTSKQNISPEILDCWEPSKSLTLPRKMKTKDSDDNEVKAPRDETRRQQISGASRMNGWGDV